MIENVINSDVTHSKTAIGQRNQKCYAVKSGVNRLLDVARAMYKESIDDVHELVKKYSGEEEIIFQTFPHILCT